MGAEQNYESSLLTSPGRSTSTGADNWRLATVSKASDSDDGRLQQKILRRSICTLSRHSVKATAG